MRMLPLQRAEMLLQIQVAFVAHAEIQMDRLCHAQMQRALHNRLDRRQPRAARQRQDRPAMVFAQKRNAARAFNGCLVARLQTLQHVRADFAARHQADMEFQHRLARLAGHGIIAGRQAGEGDGGILPGGKYEGSAAVDG